MAQTTATIKLDSLTIPASNFLPSVQGPNTLLIQNLAKPDFPEDTPSDVRMSVRMMQQKMLPEGVVSVGGYTYRKGDSRLVEAQVIVFKDSGAAARKWNNKLAEPNAPMDYRSIAGGAHKSFEMTHSMKKRYVLVGPAWISAQELNPNSELDYLVVLQRYVKKVEEALASSAASR
jgi:hypothetical protein